ncbi:MAG TPA: cytochrome c [Bacteroidia bacterium]|nr:cytochrome c [Bacteroidia bacterium]
MKKLFLITFTSVIVISACKTSKETAKVKTAVVKPALDCKTTEITYAEIKPIFEKNCTSCHGYGGSGGFNFLSSVDIKRAAAKGELLGAIKHESGFPRMPARAEQLSQADIDKIECWINNGMKE